MFHIAKKRNHPDNALNNFFKYLYKETNKMPRKREKIVIGINSLVATTHAAYSNHMQMFYRLGRSYPQFDFCFVNPPRMSIDRMRNTAAETALDIEAKYLLFVDDDVLIPWPFDFLNKLIQCKAPIAAADVLIRGYPFNHMLFKYTDKSNTGLEQIQNFPKNHKLGQLPVDAVGFSLALIDTKYLLQLPKPYFITGVNNTEDIYFCVKMRDKFPDCKIMADTSIKCGHILWSEVIDADNKVAYKKYFETMNGKPDKKKIKDDEFRGRLYLDLVKKEMGIK